MNASYPKIFFRLICAAIRSPISAVEAWKKQTMMEVAIVRLFHFSRSHSQTGNNYFVYGLGMCMPSVTCTGIPINKNKELVRLRKV